MQAGQVQLLLQCTPLPAFGRLPQGACLCVHAALLLREEGRQAGREGGREGGVPLLAALTCQWL